MEEKYLATVINQEGGPTFELVLRGLQMFAVGKLWLTEVPDGNFERRPTNRDLVERIYALFDSPEWEIADCFTFNY